MGGKHKEVTFKIDGVSPLSRELFHQMACYRSEATKGEYLSNLLLDLAKREFGEDGLALRVDVFERVQSNKYDISNE